MNVEIRTEDAQFPEKEYINGIFVAVQLRKPFPASIGKNIYLPPPPNFHSPFSLVMVILMKNYSSPIP
jgi:hypothetical protein